MIFLMKCKKINECMGNHQCNKQFTEWWDAGMVTCLGRDADLHIPSLCHCHSLSLASVNLDWFYLPGWPTVLLVMPLVQCVICCLSVCNVLYCGETVRPS